MKDWTVHLLRHHVLQYVNRLRIYVSMLPDSEPEVREKLSGPDGVNTAARIADRVLAELGHIQPVPDAQSTSGAGQQSLRAARQSMGNGRR